MSKRVLLLLAQGFEEIEAVSIIDILRRAEICITSASIDSNIEVVGANNITLKADVILNTLKTNEFDMVVLPGGLGGAQKLADSSAVTKLLQEFNSANRLLGAICAAPTVLGLAGVLKNRYTCYPSFEEKITSSEYVKDEKVVVDENIITSQGPATAMEFALMIVKTLVGNEKYLALRSGLLMD